MDNYNASIYTNRLLLRKISLSDAIEIYSYSCKDQVSKYTIWDTHRSINDTESYINTVIYKYQNGEPSDWGIIDLSTNKLIGTIGWVYINPTHYRAEIGYALSPTYWNKGIITEAARSVLQFGFNYLSLNRIEARCHLENVTSERVMQKIGMYFEGILRDYLWAYTQSVSVKLYSITRKDDFRF